MWYLLIRLAHWEFIYCCKCLGIMIGYERCEIHRQTHNRTTGINWLHQLLWIRVVDQLQVAERCQTTAGRNGVHGNLLSEGRVNDSDASPPSPLIAYSTYLLLFTPLALSLFLPPRPEGIFKYGAATQRLAHEPLCSHPAHAVENNLGFHSVLGLKRAPVCLALRSRI